MWIDNFKFSVLKGLYFFRTIGSRLGSLSLINWDDVLGSRNVALDRESCRPDIKRIVRWPMNNQPNNTAQLTKHYQSSTHHPRDAIAAPPLGQPPLLGARELAPCLRRPTQSTHPTCSSRRLSRSRPHRPARGSGARPPDVAAAPSALPSRPLASVPLASTVRPQPRPARGCIGSAGRHRPPAASASSGLGHSLRSDSIWHDVPKHVPSTILRSYRCVPVPLRSRTAFRNGERGTVPRSV